MQIWQQLALLLLLAGALVAMLPTLFVVRRRKKPEERERLRRLRVNQHGRLGEALINDVQSDTIFYSYTIAGVAYSAAQDVSTLHQQLPDDPNHLAGFAKVKYETGNPANSIVVCEQWSGIRSTASNGASDSPSRHEGHVTRSELRERA